MRDNKTSQPAHEYDGNIRKTIPFYDLFNDYTLSLVELVNPNPGTWLETGCGTGTLAQKAIQRFPHTRFTLADPSVPMLEIAKEKTAGIEGLTFLAAGTENLECAQERFDVITAILSHHYFDVETRCKATANCFRMLKEGGLYITFETILPNTEQGKQIGLEWWRRAQLRHGKSEADAEKHVKRYGVELFPINVALHLDILRDAGFAAAEVFWLSGLQAGFYAIK